MNTAGERVRKRPTEGANSHKRSGRPDQMSGTYCTTDTPSGEPSHTCDAPKEQTCCKGSRRISQVPRTGGAATWTTSPVAGFQELSASVVQAHPTPGALDMRVIVLGAG